MDVILVNSCDEMQRIIDWSKGYIREYGTDFEIPFNSVEIKVADENLKFTMVKNADRYDMTVYCPLDSGKFIEVGGCKCAFDIGTFGQSAIVENSKWYAGYNERARRMMQLVHIGNRTFEKQLIKFAALMTFAVFYREEIEKTATVERKALPPRKQPKGKKKKGSSKRCLHTVTYTVPSEIATTLKPVRRAYTKCDHEINVRGHLRRYSSGKTVWIQPFTKNSGKKAGAGKVYEAKIRQQNTEV